MRRRPPPEVDPDRLRSLLASARPRPEPVGASGWVPDEAPPEAPSTDAGGWDDMWRAGDDGRRLGDGAGGAEPLGTGLAGADTAGGEAAGGEAAGEAAGGGLWGGGRHRSPPRVLTVPVALRGARIAVSVRAVVAFLLLLILAVVFFAVRVARAQEAAAPQPVAAGQGVVGRTSVPSAFASGTSGSSVTSSSAGPSGPASGPSATPVVGAENGSASARGSPGRLVVIDVVGQVARPGVVTVADGARVVDVLVAAGGPLPGADVQRLNLARIVVDGEQVFVPRPGETPPVAVGPAGGAAGGVVGPGSGGASGAAGDGASGSRGGLSPTAPVDLNSANLAALDTLPGVGPVLAQRILDWRSQHGRFSSVDELGEVSGIGDKLLEQIRPKVRV
jgi:competence protein ComEA